MGKKRCMLIALINLILGGISAVVYLPYFFESFNIRVDGWSNAVSKLLANNQHDVLILLGIMLLSYIIITNLITILFSKNLSSLCFRLSSIIALLLPLAYVLALQFNSMLELWIKYVAANVKTISLIVVVISCGLLLLGIISSITKNRKLSIYLLMQTIAMCAIEILLISVNGWLGWTVNAIKGFGILTAIFPVYLLTSVVILLFGAKNKETV